MHNKHDYIEMHKVMVGIGKKYEEKFIESAFLPIEHNIYQRMEVIWTDEARIVSSSMVC